MAVIKTAATYFGGKQYQMRATVRADGTFRIGLPAFARDALGKDCVESDTLDKVIRAFNVERQTYAEMLQSERRVIRYVFQIQERSQRYGGDERDDISFGVGKAVQLGVANLYETAHADVEGKILRRSYEYQPRDGVDDPMESQPYPGGFNYGQFDSMESLRDDECHTIEWTQEREDWFVVLCRAIESLIDKLKTLDEDEAKLLKAVNDRLLLGVAE